MNKKLFISMSGLAVLLVAGCGTPTLTGAQPSTATAKTTASGSSGITADNPSAQVPSTSTNATSSQTTTTTSVTQSKSGALKQQHINLSVLPGGKLGPDGKKHDAFSPSNFTIVEGVPVTVTIYNFDDMQHSLTATSLGLNVQAAPSKKDGDPGVTTVTFTPTKAGNFEWRCIDPCDLENNQWAMSQQGYMMGTITVSDNPTSTSQTGQTSGSSSDASNDNGSVYGGMMGGSSGVMGGSSGVMNGQYGGGMGGSRTGSGMGSMMGGGTSR